jgi:hypothetical protein
MIVISAGLQKSGSGLYFNLTNDLLIAAGKEDIRKIRDKYNLHDILKYHNCNVGILSEDNIKHLLPVHEAGHTFVVKTHAGPSEFAKRLIEEGIIKVTCIFRDPRDVVLSAVDHGEKIRNQGQSHTFASCTSVENTIPLVESWLENSIMKWLELENVLLTKYENLVVKPVEELERLAAFLGIEAKGIDLEALYAGYRHKELDDFQKDYLHFNVGIPGRFRSVLEEKDLNRCTAEFSQYLEKMEYMA